jgi:hydrogenase-4 component B
MRTMPWTGRSFFVGAAAISGLPPLNGFVGEFLIYSAALVGVASGDRGLAAGMVVTIGVLALTGGLAAAVFAKAFGTVFLGLPRSEAAIVGGEPGGWMSGPMVTLALACAALGLLPFAALRVVRYATVEASGASLDVTAAALAPAGEALERVALVAGVLVAIAFALIAVRARLLAGTGTTLAPTWATAYLAPSPRMQYTASSFAAPLTTLFRRALRMESAKVSLDEYFPGPTNYDSRAHGLIREPLLEPLFRTGARAAVRLRWLQHGRIQLYLVNIAAALLVLLIWKLGL